MRCFSSSEVNEEGQGTKEPNVGDSRTKWNELTEAVTKAVEDICGTQEKKVLNPWMAGREGEIQQIRANITGIGFFLQLLCKIYKKFYKFLLHTPCKIQ